MAYTIETKSMLAKLMAKEGIKVRHCDTKTSRFNLETRTLTCPVWQDMSGDLYDLLLGHEIAHALFTPIEGWHDSIVHAGGMSKADARTQASYKNFLNVIEDARIEKLIKQQYPGLRKPMINGYKELLARDFFGLSAISDYSSLYLIDKLNLAAKCGTMVNIRFTADEQPYYNALMAVESWADVVELANRLFDYSRTEQHRGAVKKQQLAEHLMESHPDFYLEDEDEDVEDDYQHPPHTWENNTPVTVEERNSTEERTSAIKTDEDRQAMIEQSISEREPEPGSGPGAGAGVRNEEDFIPEVHTDQAFRNAENQLIEDASTKYYEITIPIPTLKNIVVPASRVNRGLSLAFIPFREEGTRILNEFKQKNEDYISLLAKEFEMKKAARVHAKSKTSTTGDIDITKLASFRTEDNIFRKSMVIHKGKSHGLVLLLDKSGSMADHIEGAMEQIVVMAMFCRKVNIPFVAYSFTDCGEPTRVHDFPGDQYMSSLVPFTKEEGNLVMGDLSFRELFNSRMPAAEFNTAIMNHLLLAKKLNRSRREYLPLPDQERMGGTPLNEAIIVLRDLIREFQMQHRLDIVNTIVVHDGDSNGNNQFYGEERPNSHDTDSPWKTYHHFSVESNRVVLRDDANHFAIHVPRHGRGITIALMKWLQTTTGSGIFGFYITDITPAKVQLPLEKLYQNRQGIKLVCRYDATPDQEMVLRNLSCELIKEKFLESYTDGYTRLYFIPGAKELKTESDMLETPTKGTWTKSLLLKAFKKVTRKRTVNRVLVSRFIQLIAE